MLINENGLERNGTGFGFGVYPGSRFVSIARQGYDGGNGQNLPYLGGGGGSAVEGGGTTPGSPAPLGRGGTGLVSSFSGTPAAYAGGGSGNGGGTEPSGSGGGPSGNGATNTGGGGGAYALGGSGVVMIRYDNSLANVSTTGSPTYTNNGTYKIYKWTGAGSFTFTS